MPLAQKRCILGLWLLQNTNKKLHAESQTSGHCDCTAIGSGRNGNKPSQAPLEKHLLGDYTISRGHIISPHGTLLVTHRHSIAKQGGCFQQSLSQSMFTWNSIL